MEFITDRTLADVRAGTAKGFYNYTDLNRVESAVEAIISRLNERGENIHLSVKTDWTPGGSYPDNWPSQAQLQRYLANVELIRSYYALDIALPETMSMLDYTGANAIEQVLQQAWQLLFGAQTNQEEHTDE